MLRLLAAAFALAVGTTLVCAQNLAVIKERRNVMKTIAKASGINFKMMKGAIPFDLAKAKSNLQTIEGELPKLKSLFPDDSKSGGDTDASAKIWQEKAEFDAVIDQFVADVKGTENTIKDAATFKAQYPKIVQGCGNCHKDRNGFAPRLADSFKKLDQ